MSSAVDLATFAFEQEKFDISKIMERFGDLKREQVEAGLNLAAAMIEARSAAIHADKMALAVEQARRAAVATDPPTSPWDDPEYSLTAKPIVVTY